MRNKNISLEFENRVEELEKDIGSKRSLVETMKIYFMSEIQNMKSESDLNLAKLRNELDSMKNERCKQEIDIRNLKYVHNNEIIEITNKNSGMQGSLEILEKRKLEYVIEINNLKLEIKSKEDENLKII